MVLLLAVLSGGCAEEGVLLEVTVSGLSQDVRSLSVQPTLAGTTLMTKSLYQSLDSFLVRLPAATRGTIAVQAYGLGGDGCPVAEGTASLRVDGPGRYPVTIPFGKLSMPGCGLVRVTKTGLAKGSVTSDPPGIECPGKCQAIFPPGTSLMLHAAADKNASQFDAAGFFQGWSGACAGTDLCKLISRAEPSEVGADFPVEFGLSSIWGSSDRDVWVPVGAKLLLHWRGAAWERVSIDVSPGFISGTGPDDIWLDGNDSMGGDDQLFHWNGVVWKNFSIGLPRPLGALFSIARNDAWVSVPDPPMSMGTANFLHWNGADWTPVVGPPGTVPQGIWGNAPDSVWAVGFNTLVLGGESHAPTPVVVRWDGSIWREISVGGQIDLPPILGGSGADNVWIIGVEGGANFKGFRWDGRSWNTVPVFSSDASLGAVWTSGPTDAWAVGNNILHWDGSTWTEAAAPPHGLLRAIWGSGPNDVWAVGDKGTILHWDGKAWSLSY